MPEHPRPRIRKIAVGFLLAALVAVGAWFGVRALQPGASPGRLTASGTLQADETLISSEVAAQIVALPVAEGAAVEAGAEVVRLDDRLIQRQLLQADTATRQILEIQQDKYVLHSPVAGIVTRLGVRLGEIATPGAVLLAIAPLNHLKLTLYIREADLAGVTVGQVIGVTADPYPNRVFNAVVTSINPRAEFTPRNIQTQTDRLNLVFGVLATVDNPDGALKPGMPVDVRFGSPVPQ